MDEATLKETLSIENGGICHKPNTHNFILLPAISYFNKHFLLRKKLVIPQTSIINLQMAVICQPNAPTCSLSHTQCVDAHTQSRK